MSRGNATQAYVLTSTTATTTAAITPAMVTPAVVVADKAYDGTTSATVTSCTVTGAIAGDEVACSATATFDAATAGVGRTVTASGLTLTGAAAGNYILSTTTATTTAAITPLTRRPPRWRPRTRYTTAPPAATLTSCTVTGHDCGRRGRLRGHGGLCHGPASGVGKTVTVNGLTLTGRRGGELRAGHNDRHDHGRDH